MHPTAEQFVKRASDQYGIEPDVREFDEGTKTAADAAEALGCDLAQIASSIVMIADGDPIVVITSGANRVDEDTIAEHLGAGQVRMAEPAEAKDGTGWSIGGVPPICHENELSVLFDETLLEHETVWAAGGTPSAVWPVAPDRLVELAEATPLSVT
jgi:prolyl-tRNA editing enzyme YbaK/EbsC (Cys-tRNA(Pro) deacylase)